MTSLNGKKLLILGAFEHSKHIIDAARRNGIYTVVTDYVTDAPAKKYADKYYDISTTDIDALEKICINERIDGVVTGYVDINLLPYYKLCKRMNYPYYCNDKQINLTMNKRNFKDLCIRNGLVVTPDIDTELVNLNSDKIDYPIIVKPADSYSSKGITVCHDSKMLSLAKEKAMGFSNCKQIVVEKFIEAEDVYLYFTVQNGIVSLSAMADRLLNNEQFGCAPQPVGYFFPSKYLDLYYNKVHSRVQNMIDEIQLKNGSFFMQGFIVDNNIMFFEMGLRLSGGCGYIQIRNQNEIDQTEMYVRYALTGNFGPWDIKQYDNPYFKKPACVLVILLGNGTIASIDGIDKIKANESYLDMIQLKNVGDKLESKGTLNQVFARIYLCNYTKEALEKSISDIKKSLKIIDTNGNNMILNLFDENEAFKEN